MIGLKTGKGLVMEGVRLCCLVIVEELVVSFHHPVIVFQFSVRMDRLPMLPNCVDCLLLSPQTMLFFLREAGAPLIIQLHAILCLQEVQHDHFVDFFQPRLASLGYEGHYKKRTGEKKDGCATFYKSSKFRCLNSVPVEYHVPGSRILDKDNVALLLTLSLRARSPSDRGTVGRCICVANTHLLYNPKRGDIKLAQIMFLLAAIDEIAAKTVESNPLYDPVVLCGDFNLVPGSDLFQLLVKGELSYEGLLAHGLSGQADNYWGRSLVAQLLPRDVDVTDHCRFHRLLLQRRRKRSTRSRDRPEECHGNDDAFGTGTASHFFGFRSAYRHGDGSITAWLKQPSGGEVVDYIMYSADRRDSRCDGVVAAPDRLRLVQVTTLPDESDVRRAGGLPNQHQSSDHLMIMATFAFGGDAR